MYSWNTKCWKKSFKYWYYLFDYHIQYLYSVHVYNMYIYTHMYIYIITAQEAIHKSKIRSHEPYQQGY